MGEFLVRQRRASFYGEVTDAIIVVILSRAVGRGTRGRATRADKGAKAAVRTLAAGRSFGALWWHQGREAARRLGCPHYRGRGGDLVQGDGTLGQAVVVARLVVGAVVDTKTSVRRYPAAGQALW